jgi:hypothetical protein
MVPSHISCATTVLGPLQRSALFQIQAQPECGIPIQIIAMQSFAPEEAQPLVQLQTRRVADLGLENDLVCAAGSHGVDGEAHEVRGDAFAAVGRLDGEHGDVAAEGPGAVRLEFADYDADEGGCGWVEGLVRSN